MISVVEEYFSFDTLEVLFKIEGCGKYDGYYETKAFALYHFDDEGSIMFDQWDCRVLFRFDKNTIPYDWCVYMEDVTYRIYMDGNPDNLDLIKDPSI